MTKQKRTRTAASHAESTSGRLAGKVALITGAAGNIGVEICRRYLREGATVVLSGRTASKLDAARDRLIAETRVPAARAIAIPFDGAKGQEARNAIQRLLAQCGRLDILVNNAGSAGPRQPIATLPFSRDELQSDTETVADAARNILGVSWNTLRAAAPHMGPGSSVINVSTIFSRTQYYGRAAYVVPKAALNALSRQLAGQLGSRGIRVNTVFPGPIESERIRSVFATMDRLRAATDGTTASDFFGMMTLARARDGQPPERMFPTVADVASMILFLGSDESAGINGHNFEVTHGMTVRQESRSTWVSRPALRTVDAAGATVLIVAGGEHVGDALAVARVQARCGARVILGVPTEAEVHLATEALDPMGTDRQIQPVWFDRTRPESLQPTLDAIDGALMGAIILPAYGPERFLAPLHEASDADVEALIVGELSGALAVARALTRYWHGRGDALRLNPRVVFLSNPDDGAGNAYADMLRAATEQLIRVWRDETMEQTRSGARRWVEWGNQIIRWSNREAEGLPFAAGQAARLLYSPRRIRQVNLYLPDSIVEATGARRATFGWMESLMGTHLGKVALVTGGSAGIGGQIGRLLAVGGARVMLVARGEAQLIEMRGRIVDELVEIGYYAATDRVRYVAGVDVADEASLQHAVDETIRAFGHVDYLVNNAGVAGAEEMVVDMSLDDWRATLDANLVSNYSLIQKLVPRMKRQGSGYVVNVSSYFGGEKYVAVPYPNRADYAVSKAGQRALVENLARYLGPEIQINAISPGPVDGDRLRGTGGRPGLFQRRGKLILENRRLNKLYELVIEAVRAGGSAAASLDLLRANDAAVLGVATAEGTSSTRFCMTPEIARKLVARVRLGGYLLREADHGARFDAAWIAGIPVPPEPFLSAADITREADKVRQGVLSMLHLRKMPTEMEVALAAVYFMADRAVSGETFQPSGGLHLERSITERELFGGAKRVRLEAMQGTTVWVIGEHLVPHMARAAAAFVTQCDVARVVLLTRTVDAARRVIRELGDTPTAGRVETLVVEGDIEEGMDTALTTWGHPSAVLSTPFTPIPERLVQPDGETMMSTAAFRDLIEGNVTHHFRVARKVSLFDNCQLVLVAPDVPMHGSAEAFDLANCIKTTLHSLTATLGVENERLVHGVPVNQINLTRRARSEEPQNEDETAEELERFARAVLLESAPIASEEESRYRSRIYRGMAITV
jgi:malonyl-CoA reductase / 3-hydroxypropionate dehydrogenase (NADP+)